MTAQRDAVARLIEIAKEGVEAIDGEVCLAHTFAEALYRSDCWGHASAIEIEELARVALGGDT